jgi:hypothetical protein
VTRIDVDLDDLLRPGVPPVLVVREIEVSEPRADDEHDVRLAPHLIAPRPVSVHVVVVVARDDRPARHRRHHRAAEQLDELKQSGVRARSVHTRAGHDGRTLGRCQKLGDLLELCLGGLRLCRTIGLGGQDGGGVLVVLLVHDRSRHLELDRPGTSRPHLAEGHACDLRHAVPGQNRPAPFDAGVERVELILALKGGGGRGIDDAQPVLRRERDERNALVTRRDHAGKQVCGARARISEHHPDLAGRLVEPLGHVTGRRLMPDRDEPDLVRLRGRQQRIDLRARNSEHEAHSLAREAPRQELSTGDIGHGLSLPIAQPMGTGRFRLQPPMRGLRKRLARATT